MYACFPGVKRGCWSAQTWRKARGEKKEAHLQKGFRGGPMRGYAAGRDGLLLMGSCYHCPGRIARCRPQLGVFLAQLDRPYAFDEARLCAV